VIELSELLILSATLFVLGVVGFIIRRNILIMFMSVELMLNAAGLVLIAFSNKLGKMDPQVFAVFVIALAAAEAAVGLAIIVALFRNRESVNIDEMKLLKW
jgi:NADH-quinone oxidoreductase subunit K